MKIVTSLFSTTLSPLTIHNSIVVIIINYQHERTNFSKNISNINFNIGGR